MISLSDFCILFLELPYFKQCFCQGFDPLQQDVSRKEILNVSEACCTIWLERNFQFTVYSLWTSVLTWFPKIHKISLNYADNSRERWSVSRTARTGTPRPTWTGPSALRGTRSRWPWRSTWSTWGRPFDLSSLLAHCPEPYTQSKAWNSKASSIQYRSSTSFRRYIHIYTYLFYIYSAYIQTCRF